MMFIKALIFLLPFWNMVEYKTQKFDIVGTWDAYDPIGNSSTLVFTEDGFFSLTLDGAIMGGKEFDLNGSVHSLVYTVEYNDTTAQVIFKLIEQTVPVTEKTKTSAYLTFENDNHAKLLFNVGSLPSSGAMFWLGDLGTAPEEITVTLSRRKSTL